ncbi:MAG TPA: alpha/beta fold hydrolase [Nocardioidaceae bacterium]|nr:alpha/beta fold hydrolase [Nocardioidaceae bacterium]
MTSPSAEASAATSADPHTGPAADIVLLPGLWLPGSAWADVAALLAELGHRPVVPVLPGVDDGSTSATLDDQLAAVLTAVDAADRPVVVGHSAASTLAWLAADRRPEAVRRVVMIGGFADSDGGVYAELFPIVDGVMSFPGWEPFEGPDADDLDAATRVAFAESAVPVPEGVASGVVRLSDERRFAVPVTLVCPEFSPDDARAWVAAGDLPELARVRALSYVDLDSGHWPMLSGPDALARLLDRVLRDG